MDLLQWVALYSLIIGAIIGGCGLALGFDWALAKWRSKRKVRSGDDSTGFSQ